MNNASPSLCPFFPFHCLKYSNRLLYLKHSRNVSQHVILLLWGWFPLAGWVLNPGLWYTWGKSSTYLPKPLTKLCLKFSSPPSSKVNLGYNILLFKDHDLQSDARVKMWRLWSGNILPVHEAMVSMSRKRQLSLKCLENLEKPFHVLRRQKSRQEDWKVLKLSRVRAEFSVTGSGLWKSWAAGAGFAGRSSFPEDTHLAALPGRLHSVLLAPAPRLTPAHSCLAFATDFGLVVQLRAHLSLFDQGKGTLSAAKGQMFLASSLSSQELMAPFSCCWALPGLGVQQLALFEGSQAESWAERWVTHWVAARCLRHAEEQDVPRQGKRRRGSMLLDERVTAHSWLSLTSFL